MGILFAILSAFTIAGASLASKKALDKEHSLGFALIVHMLGLLFLFPLTVVIDLSITRTELAWMYLASWFGAFGFLMITKAMRHLEVSIVVPLMNISVIFVVVLAWIFLGEHLGVVKILGIMMIAFGGYLLEVNHHGLHIWRPLRKLRSSRHFRHLAFGIFLYAFSSIIDKIVLRSVAPLAYLFFVYLFLVFNYVFLIFLLRPKGGFRVIVKEAKKSRLWTLLFVVLRLVSNIFYVYAVSMVFLSLAVAIKRMSSLVAIVLSGRIFHEENIAWKLCVSSLMVSGVLFAIFG